MNKIKIKHFSIIWMILFLLCFRPASYLIGNGFNRMLNGITVLLGIGLFAFTFFLKRFEYSMNISIKLIILLYFWTLIGSSIINSLLGNKIDYSDAIVYFFSALYFILLCDIGLWYSPKDTIESFLIVGVLMCSINAITMLAYGKIGGIYHEQTYAYGRLLISQDYYFLGRDNATYFWSWPVLVMVWLFYYKYKANWFTRIVAIGYNVLLVTSYLYVWSVLAAVACISVPILMFLLIQGLERERRDKKYNNKLINLVKFQVLWPIGLLFNALLSTGIIIKFFYPIIQNVFHKRITLTERTLIWSRAYMALKESPIIGFGCEPTELSIVKILINHTHNLFLETLYRGGIVGILLLVIALVVIGMITDKVQKSAIQKFLIAMFFVFIICSSVYFAYYRYHYLIILVFLCHTELFDN